jgi:hypothetical protein
MKTSILTRVAALGGILSVVLQMTGQIMIQTGGQEPHFNAGSNEIVSFFMNRHADLAATGSFLSLLSFIPFIFFLGVFWKKLKRDEDSPGWLSAITLGSGLLVIVVQSVAGAGWTIMFNRINKEVLSDLATYQFDFGNYLFASSWVFIASMLISSGLLSLAKNALPKWIGIPGLIIALGLLIAAAFWFSPSGVIFVPVSLYWIWLISVSVYLFVIAKKIAL